MGKWVFRNAAMKNRYGKDKDKKARKDGFSTENGLKIFFKRVTFSYFEMKIFISCPKEKEGMKNIPNFVSEFWEEKYFSMVSISMEKHKKEKEKLGRKGKRKLILMVSTKLSKSLFIFG